MIVQRATFHIKAPYMQQAFDLLKSQRAARSNPSGMRIYGSMPEGGGPSYVVIFEIEVENLAALEQFWAEWFAGPESATFLAKWEPLLEPGGFTEIWALIE